MVKVSSSEQMKRICLAKKTWCGQASHLAAVTHGALNINHSFFITATPNMALEPGSPMNLWSSSTLRYAPQAPSRQRRLSASPNPLKLLCPKRISSTAHSRLDVRPMPAPANSVAHHTLRKVGGRGFRQRKCSTEIEQAFRTSRTACGVFQTRCTVAFASVASCTFLPIQWHTRRSTRTPRRNRVAG